ncbi:vegetative cell wall protein gp1-like [Vicia villosa]|uniref:vegetative cell wall protein gp1-like n=1 Tax=Vicia villosa TaxID=3911 RepID=UPI00273C50F1|nr:vegetative cell wall protein gp1-like [Vicia villosa]XP_058780889.1 vegetative cell wall protein gp1-like [Vicia villosa]
MAKTSASVFLVVLVVALFLNGYNAAESVQGGYEPAPPKADQPPPPTADQPPPAPPKADQPPPAPPSGQKPCFFGICPIFNCGAFCFGIGYATGECTLVIRCCCS